MSKNIPGFIVLKSSECHNTLIPLLEFAIEANKLEFEKKAADYIKDYVGRRLWWTLWTRKATEEEAFIMKDCLCDKEQSFILWGYDQFQKECESVIRSINAHDSNFELHLDITFHSKVVRLNQMYSK